MLEALDGQVPNPPFDPVAYNNEVMEEFYSAVGVPVDPS
jgi:hypothetical protein